MRDEKKCIVCGRNLTGRRRIICSPECQKWYTKFRKEEELNTHNLLSRELICPICGKAFTTSNKDKIYCSSECRIEKHKRDYHNKKRQIRNLTCPKCGTLFQTKNPWQKYCSKHCAENNRPSHKGGQIIQRHKRRICPFCGKGFQKKQNQSNQSWGIQKYCSKRCKNKAGAINHAQKKEKGIFKKSELRTLTCPDCGKEFQTRHTQKIFCCTYCKDHFRGHHPERKKHSIEIKQPIDKMELQNLPAELKEIYSGIFHIINGCCGSDCLFNNKKDAYGNRCFIGLDYDILDGCSSLTEDLALFGADRCDNGDMILKSINAPTTKCPMFKYRGLDEKKLPIELFIRIESEDPK